MATRSVENGRSIPERYAHPNPLAHRESGDIRDSMYPQDMPDSLPGQKGNGNGEKWTSMRLMESMGFDPYNMALKMPKTPMPEDERVAARERIVKTREAQRGTRTVDITGSRGEIATAAQLHAAESVQLPQIAADRSK